MIFKVFKIRNMIKEGKENPGKFAGNQAGELLMSMFVMPIISAIVFLGGLLVLGFTTLLGGPYGLAKFLFYIVLFFTFFLSLILRKVYLLVKKSTKNTVEQTIKVESKVVEE